MTNSKAQRLLRVTRVFLLLASVLLSSVLPIVAARPRQDDHLEMRLRSFSAGASGRLQIEPTEGGGRGRLTALGLPPPTTFAPAASTFVVWAVSEGRFVRLGELRVDARGNGGLEFAHPTTFERYTVLVTAESAGGAARPGAPVLSTRAGEAAALFARPAPPTTPAPTERPTETAATPATPMSEPERATVPTPTPPPVETTPPPATTPTATPPTTTPATRPAATPPPPRRAAPPLVVTRPRRYSSGVVDFYGEIDNALIASGGGRLLELTGEEVAPEATGNARVAAQTGTAFVRLRLRDVPLPSTVGANTYVLWATQPDGRIVYMGSLPTTTDLNRADVYVRTMGGFGADDFRLFVTAERQRPASNPSGRRALSTRREGANVR